MRNSTKKLITFVGAERKLVVSVALTAAAGYAFIGIAEDTMEGETAKLDNAVLESLRSTTNTSQPIGPEWLLPAAQDISALGGVAVTTLLITTICGYFLLKKKLRMMLFLLASVIGGTVANVLLKDFFGRTRPSIVPPLEPTMDESFPSGHSMLSAIVYLTLAAMLAKSTSSTVVKIYYMVIGIGLAVLIGLSRLYLGVHYPTDVVAGWCAGLAWAAMSYTIAAWLQRKGSVERETPSP